MLVATSVVAVMPLAVSLGLRASGVISSPWLSVSVAILLSLGASTAGSAYWRKHGNASEVLFSELLVWGWIRRLRQERELTNAAGLLDRLSPGHEQALSVDRREQLLRQVATGLEGQDAYLNGHSRRVARHATMIARGMGLPSVEVARIRAAAAVHDVGKLRTPREILNKPGRLTDLEFEVIKRHPVDGAEMVAAIDDPELTQIVRHHHERLDGAGYPDGLAGDRIPVGARIIAVADTFDAITSVRPYRAAAPHQKAIDILRREAGTQLDPDAVRAFLAYYSGSRPTAVWAIAISSLRRVIAWLTGDPAAAATVSAGKVAVATAATAAIGVAAGAAPVRPIHPARPIPIVASRDVAGARRELVSVTKAARFVPPSAARSGVVAIPAIRLRGARGAAGHLAVRSRRAHRAPAGHSATGTVAAPGMHVGASSPASGASASPTAPAAVSGAAGGGSSTPSTAGTTTPASTTNATNTTNAPASAGNSNSTSNPNSNSAASGSASHPTSFNPAGHTNHASNTGNAARNEQPPHSTPPGHSGSSNGNGHSSGATTVPAPPVAPIVVTPPMPPPTEATGSSHGNGDANGNGNGNGNDSGNGAENGHGNGHGNGNAEGQTAVKLVPTSGAATSVWKTTQ
ncbi:MAG TPA: HD-GYP domain-containing protein [Solirubrobacteraceae bacterium]